jgi:hypothetical protein
MKTYVHDYPSGEDPRFCINGSYVYSIPDDQPVYLITGNIWSAWPGGGAPILVTRGDLVYSYPPTDTPIYCLRR